MSKAKLHYETVSTGVDLFLTTEDAEYLTDLLGNMSPAEMDDRVEDCFRDSRVKAHSMVVLYELLRNTLEEK